MSGATSLSNSVHLLPSEPNAFVNSVTLFSGCARFLTVPFSRRSPPPMGSFSSVLAGGEAPRNTERQSRRARAAPICRRFLSPLGTGFSLPGARQRPKDVIGKLNAATVEALADPAVQSRLANLGLGLFPTEQQTPDVDMMDNAKPFPHAHRPNNTSRRSYLQRDISRSERVEFSNQESGRCGPADGRHFTALVQEAPFFQ
jgi:hypothetical protein